MLVLEELERKVEIEIGTWIESNKDERERERERS